MSPEVLAQRIEQMPAQQLQAIVMTLTPQTVQAISLLLPEIQPLLEDMLRHQQRVQPPAQQPPQQPQQAPAQAAPQGAPQGVQAFMQSVGGGR